MGRPLAISHATINTPAMRKLFLLKLIVEIVNIPIQMSIHVSILWCDFGRSSPLRILTYNESESNRISQSTAIYILVKIDDK